MKKILFICMPFGALDRQALGISILKACLLKAGIKSEIKYLNFKFAELIGAEDYYWVSNSLPHIAFAGEWVFRECLFGPDRQNDYSYINNILIDEWRLSKNDIDRILHIRMLTLHFLEYCKSAIKWNDYAIIGFTSTFEQNFASLSLAKFIKQNFPNIRIIFGGANLEDQMGIELHQNFKFIDFVCSGESELSFPKLVDCILTENSESKRLKKIKGIVFRDKNKSVFTGPPELVKNLDSLPIPEYSDFYKEFEESCATDSVIPTILFESSRGCWWGYKNQCTFCGLNGKSLCFRSKSSKRVMKEMDYLSATWNNNQFQAVDNVVDLEYFKNLFPILEKRNPKFSIFYEIRSNLKREDVKKLHKAGINQVQPGIESLSNHVLKIMNKGTNTLQNVQLLKWCKEYSISASWNILYGFPGELEIDYTDSINIIKSIKHLNPPTSYGPIRLDRFSPYYNYPLKYGIKNLKPINAYKYLYPFDDNSLERLAYYFNFEYDSDYKPDFSNEKLLNSIIEWKRNPDNGILKSFYKPDNSLCLIDSRSIAIENSYILAGIDKDVYEYCDTYQSLSAVLCFIQEKYLHTHFSREQVLAFLNNLVKKHLMLTDGIHFLSLALNIQ